MKKILSLILAILGIGLLISCVGKLDFDKLNDTTHDNQTTIIDVVTQDNTPGNTDNPIPNIAKIKLKIFFIYN